VVGVRVGVLAGLSNTAFLLAYYEALDISRMSVVVPIMQTSLLLVIRFSVLFLSHLETVTPRLLSATAVIVTGGVLVTFAG
jgi:drug/metabolite transporter, DME family